MDVRVECEYSNEYYIGRTDAEAEAPKLCPPDTRSGVTRRPLSWERLRTEDKAAAEDEMLG